MPEGANAEVAHHLHERGRHGAEGSDPLPRSDRVLEIGEAILLALVAIATAWSGYQAARWDGRSAERYAEASKYRVEQDLAATQGGQERIYNSGVFNSWIVATTTGDQRAATILERRFTDNYAVAFEAWLKTDPFNDPNAPAGPAFMPEYRNEFEQRATTLGEQASTAFEEGASSRERGEDFVRVTVIMAMVLFLIAISQRFEVRKVRMGLIVVALAFLVTGVSLLVSYPRL